MEILMTNAYERERKKLHSNQTPSLKTAVKTIVNEPTIGDLKIGDLHGVRVYKFHILQQLTLLAYIYNEQKEEITLVSFGPHENFYSNLKNQINN